MFKQYFESLEGIEGLQKEIANVNRILQEKMKAYDVDITKKEQLWSTCIAVVHITDETIQYAQLGDCMIVATFRDGTVQVLTKDTVKGISRRAKKKREEDRKNSLSVPGEHVFNDIREQLMYNRYLANMPNGYSVANGMPEAVALIQQGTLPRAEVTDIFICSDGLFHPDWSLVQTAQYMMEKGAAAYVNIIEELEQKKWIRPDDKTVIMIHM